MNILAIAAYLQNNARPLDLALYNFYFADGDAAAVLRELAAYQNEDGGFSKGIEPDTQLPLSSAIGTSVAFQYLTAVKASADEPMVKRGIEYLLRTHNMQTNGWDIVPKEVDDYPHAPWWGYASAFGPNGFGWGNPAAEILGYLLAYKELVGDDALLESITQTAIKRLEQLQEPEFHELFCYMRLYDQADQSLQARLYPALSRHITAAVNTDPNSWNEYGATPLKFVKSPDSPFAELFDKVTIAVNLDHLEHTITGDHWEPQWDWGPDYPDAWAQAKQDWAGKLTVENLLTLKVFGRLL